MALNELRVAEVEATSQLPGEIGPDNRRCSTGRWREVGDTAHILATPNAGASGPKASTERHVVALAMIRISDLVT
jgi:hypothetical protein